MIVALGIAMLEDCDKIALWMERSDVKIYMTKVRSLKGHVQNFASGLTGKILSCDYTVPSSGNNSVVSFGEIDE